MVGHDPDGWVTVDPHTGNITTAKRLDRESPYVVDNIYTVIMHAVDNGKTSALVLLVLKLKTHGLGLVSQDYLI